MAEDRRDASIYRELNSELRDGLKNIYLQISTASSSTNALFQEASEQLKEVLRATESAAMNIMDIVESQIAESESSRQTLEELIKKHPDEPGLQDLLAANAKLETSLTSVLTALSFQDITGQRLGKVTGALAEIEKSVVDLYLSSGLALEAAEKDPTRDAKSVQAEAVKTVSEFRGGSSTLKGPDANGCSQSTIDDMLAQLGL